MCGQRCQLAGWKSIFFTAENRPKKVVDICRQSARVPRLVMKSDTTNTILTLVLAVLVLAGVLFALKAIFGTRELRSMSMQYNAANTSLMRQQAFLNECEFYSKTHPAITSILESVEPQTAKH